MRCRGGQPMHHVILVVVAAILAVPAAAYASYCDSSCDIYSDCEQPCFNGSQWTTCASIGVCEEQGRPGGGCGVAERYRFVFKRELVVESDGQCVFFYYD